MINHQSPITNHQLPSTVYHHLYLLLALALLTACGAGEAPQAAPVATSTVAMATPTVAVVVASREPLAAADAQPPVQLRIPAIDLTVAVAPMAWQVTEFAGERRAVWQVPLDEAGWHLNSAGAGARGNTVLSGHHQQGRAVFAALARGEVVVGQTIELVDAQGRIFVYTVIEVSPPIPALAATAEDTAQAAAYLAQPATGDPAQLTLATGWPEFSDTHYMFVVASLAGRLRSGE